ncbi:hypothetical protein LAWI1_G004458 [Lachnellula willkommii]|uniref:Uncharacterized protein n=1 Tax=Lachnellula willkommii TaxID=215461 RepID=A0A559M4W7_9HELO|nr:hypothetical protein LAWI1_G004458 [Lachnellula willkommii]
MPRRIVWKAKREYWRYVIDGVQNDKDLYRVIGWHKLASNLKSPLIEHNNVVYKSTKEKAEVLCTEILDRFSVDDDLLEDPL